MTEVEASNLNYFFGAIIAFVNALFVVYFVLNLIFHIYFFMPHGIRTRLNRCCGCCCRRCKQCQDRVDAATEKVTGKKRGSRKFMDEFDKNAPRQMHDTHSAIQSHHQEMMKVKFIVPAGVRPGQKILVDTPTGEHISVILPRMAMVGSTITVMVPKSVPNPTIPSPSIERNVINPMYSGGITPNDSLKESEDDDNADDSEDEEELDLVI